MVDGGVSLNARAQHKKKYAAIKLCLAAVCACVCVATPIDDGMRFWRWYTEYKTKCALLTERMEIDVLLIFVARERVYFFFGLLPLLRIVPCTVSDGMGNLFRI